MSEQSTAKFLISREGRPVLIGTTIAMIVFIVIGIYTWNLLFSSEPQRPDQTEEQQQQRRASAGQTSVDANRENVSPDLTSDGLTPEARAAVKEYNRKAESEGRIPVPTPDDVELVRAQPELPENPDRDSARKTPEPRNNVTKAEQRKLDQMAERRHEQLVSIHREYRSHRFEAANAMIAIFNEPPESASAGFDAGQSDSDGRDKLLRVARNEDGTASVRAGTGAGAGGVGGRQCSAPLVKAGEIRYAKTDIALNTDFRGPVRMTFLDGALRGWIGMGSFELNELGARMKLKITRVIDPDGQTHDVSAWVLDPETTLWAMASDVDRHIIYRYGGFGLGTILSAFSILAENRAQESQIVTPDGTVATSNREPDTKQVVWTMLGEFGRLFEESFRDNINRPITVTLDPGEEAGVLFENTVCEIDSQITRDRRDLEKRAALGLADPLR